MIILLKLQGLRDEEKNVTLQVTPLACLWDESHLY